MKYHYFKLGFVRQNHFKDHRKKGNLTIISVFTASGDDERFIFGEFFQVQVQVFQFGVLRDCLKISKDAFSDFTG